jgi:DNA invertase Pin-like site-specific DNA recombinase
MSTTITASHLSKPAYIYIRQSTLAQVRQHQESTERQYALKDKALAMGWPLSSIRVLDADQGMSGTQSMGRQDFKTLVADVSMGQVGAVFALEVSRLARSNVDWLRLLELCALTHTLVIDADGSYDPADFNDGLLLGLKGTMAQAELHFLRGRLQGGKLNKARKGELRSPLPVGYAYDDDGRIVIDPDDEVCGAVRLVFRLFEEEGSAYGVVQRFAREGLRFPKRAYGGAWRGKLIWGRLDHGRVLSIIGNPTYAGSYIFGRFQSVKTITPDGQVHAQPRQMPQAQWRVHLPDHHEGYITQQQFEANAQRMAHNRTNGQGRVLCGAAREGMALLQGLLLCANCGRALSIRYQGNGGIYPTYECNWLRREGLATRSCIAVRADPLDAAIGQEVLKALKPTELKLAMAALDDLEQRDEALMRQWNMRIERAAYECALTERRYEEVDPANRLVAASLERRWNQALTNLDAIKAEAAKYQRQSGRVVSAEQKAKVMDLARDLPRLWRAATTQSKDRKRMLRLLIRDITVQRVPESRQIVLHVRWQGGACSDMTVTPPLPIAQRLRYSSTFVDEVRELAHQMGDVQIAQVFNDKGVRSSKGKLFTASMIQWVRFRHQVPAYRPMRPEEITVRELARRLGVSIHFVHYWIQRDIIQARQIVDHGPWWITLTEQEETQLHERVQSSGHLQNHH